jgi:hypothetical protein
VGGRDGVPKSPLQLLSSGPHIPLLVGFDREEDAGFGPPTLPYTTDNWVRDTNSIAGPSFGRQIRSLYPADAYDALVWSTVTRASRLQHPHRAVRRLPVRRPLAVDDHHPRRARQGPVYRRRLLGRAVGRHPPAGRRRPVSAPGLPRSGGRATGRWAWRRGDARSPAFGNGMRAYEVRAGVTGCCMRCRR